jgi:tRNA modification GTPase
VLLESARRFVYLDGGRLELAAADLREAARAMDLLVGRIDVEALLDDIFRSFCIGK